MRLKYQVVKELCQLMTAARIQIRDSENILEKLKKLHWSDNNSCLTVEDYQYHFTKFCNVPETVLLDEVIEKLEELSDSNSKLADYSGLKSDMEWLDEYYKERSWNDVMRWLTNIDSELRETFSNYIDAIKEKRGNNSWNNKKQIKNNRDNNDNTE